MTISQKIAFALAVIASCLTIDALLSHRLLLIINEIHSVDTPKEKHLNNALVSVWQTAHTTDAYRLTSNEEYKVLFEKEVAEVQINLARYDALGVSTKEQQAMAEFRKLWHAMIIEAETLIKITDRKTTLSTKLFGLIDDLDNIIDKNIQAEWNTQGHINIYQERRLREVEVSLWESIHAAKEYTGISHAIIRSDRDILAGKTIEGAEASAVVGTFKDLLAQQITDVETFWAQYKNGATHDYEFKAIEQFDSLWPIAIKTANTLVLTHDQSNDSIENLHNSVTKIDQILNNKIQEYQQEHMVHKTEDAANYTRIIESVAGVTLFLIPFIWYMFNKDITQRIKTLGQLARNIGDGALDIRANTTPSDEIGELGESFNRMAEGLAAAKQKIEQKNQDLILSNQHKTDFLNCISHEIKTPMNGILGMLQLLANDNLTEQQRHKIKLAKSSANSLLTIINDILDFSRIEENTLELNTFDFNLPDLFGNICEAAAPRIYGKGLDIILDLKQINESLVHGDANRLQIIINSLLSNAIKFTESGHIIIRPHLYKNKYQKRTLECKIIDTGIGIELDKQKDIFNSFTQEDGSSTRRYGGTGIGLSIAKGLCELMQGTIEVDSAPKKGSTFSFTVDLEAVNPNTILKPTVELDNLNILIFEPNEAAGDNLCSELTRWGAKARNVTEIDAAIDIVTESKNDTKFDVIFIALNKVDSDGTTLSKFINNDAVFNDVKIIIMAESLSEQDLTDQDGMAFDTFALKPMTFYSITQALETLTNTSVNEDNNALDADTSPGTPPTQIHSQHNPRDRILIVEDNLVNQEVIRGILEDNFDCDIANHGAEALEMLKQAGENKQYKLILMDCQMPIMDGFTATKAIRKGEAGERYIDIPVIAITANAMESDKKMGLAAGMNEYLTKPIDAITLLEVLEQYVDSA